MRDGSIIRVVVGRRRTEQRTWQRDDIVLIGAGGGAGQTHIRDVSLMP
jgi:hypothetical protein